MKNLCDAYGLMEMLRFPPFGGLSMTGLRLGRPFGGHSMTGRGRGRPFGGLSMTVGRPDGHSTKIPIFHPLKPLFPALTLHCTGNQIPDSFGSHSRSDDCSFFPVDFPLWIIRIKTLNSRFFHQ